VVVAGIFFTALATRGHLDVNVIADRNPIYVTLSDGSIRNGYTLNVLNKTLEEHRYSLSLEGLEEYTLSVQGSDLQADSHLFTIGPDTVRAIKAFVAVPAEALQGETQTFYFKVIEDTAPGETPVEGNYSATFRGPEE